MPGFDAPPTSMLDWFKVNRLEQQILELGM